MSSPRRLSGPSCRAAGLEGVAPLSEQDMVLQAAPGLLTVIAHVHTLAGRPGHSGSLAGGLGAGDACGSLLGFLVAERLQGGDWARPPLVAGGVLRAACGLLAAPVVGGRAFPAPRDKD